MEQRSLVERGMPVGVAHDVARAIAAIADEFEAQAVVIFGSYAAGDARADSDLDLLVVAAADDRWQLASRLYLRWHELRGRLARLPRADILAYTPEQFLAAQVVGFPAWQAAREGVVVHGRLPQPSGAVAG